MAKPLEERQRAALSQSARLADVAGIIEETNQALAAATAAADEQKAKSLDPATPSTEAREARHAAADAEHDRDRHKSALAVLEEKRVALLASEETALRLREYENTLADRDALAKDLRERGTIPAGRMKAGKEHIVALSDEAIDVFKRASNLRLANAELIFPGAKRGAPMSDMTLVKIMRDMKVAATPHGFRSSFRDWAADQTSFPGEVADAALAHVVADKVLAAYRRTDFLEKRRQLMAGWGLYCIGCRENVVRIAARA